MSESSANTPDVTDAVEPPGPTLGQKIAVEVIGTFVLVLFGCGSAVYAGEVGQFDILGIAMAFGIAVLVMVYAFGRISGGHFNPAVSVGAALSGRIAWRDTVIYVAAQLVGAILGALALFVLLHGFDGFDATGNMGQNSFGDEGTGYAWWAALLLELVLTAIFVMVILAVTDSRNEHPGMAPLAIGLSLTAIHLVAIPGTGTSVNPARSIGPALFAGPDAILQLWLFIVGPLLGAALAGLLYPVLFGHGTDPVPGSGFAMPQRSSAPGTSEDQYQQQWNQQQSSQQQGTGAQQWGPEPIIQDGWQWDPQAQQWIPAQQQPQPPQPGQQGQTGQGWQAPPQQGQPGQQGQGRQPGQHGQWPDDGETQIRS